MEKPKKHRFVHPDPEKLPQTKTEKSSKGVKLSPHSEETMNAGKDLKKVLMSIALFTIILTIFYLINLKLDLLTRFGNLLNI